MHLRLELCYHSLVHPTCYGPNARRQLVLLEEVSSCLAADYFYCTQLLQQLAKLRNLDGSYTTYNSKSKGVPCTHLDATYVTRKLQSAIVCCRDIAVVD